MPQLPEFKNAVVVPIVPADGIYYPDKYYVVDAGDNRHLKAGTEVSGRILRRDHRITYDMSRGAALIGGKEEYVVTCYDRIVGTRVDPKAAIYAGSTVLGRRQVSLAPLYSHVSRQPITHNGFTIMVVMHDPKGAWRDGREVTQNDMDIMEMYVIHEVAAFRVDSLNYSFYDFEPSVGTDFIRL